MVLEQLWSSWLPPNQSLQEIPSNLLVRARVATMVVISHLDLASVRDLEECERAQNTWGDERLVGHDLGRVLGLAHRPFDFGWRSNLLP